VHLLLRDVISDKLGVGLGLQTLISEDWHTSPLVPLLGIQPLGQGVCHDVELALLLQRGIPAAPALWRPLLSCRNLPHIGTQKQWL
jgi:hypothetical protein